MSIIATDNQSLGRRNKVLGETFGIEGKSGSFDPDLIDSNEKQFGVAYSVPQRYGSNGLSSKDQQLFRKWLDKNCKAV